MLNLTIKECSELTDLELKQVYDLILKGDEVNSQTLSTRLADSVLLGFYSNTENKIIATAAIKKPLDTF